VIDIQLTGPQMWALDILEKNNWRDTTLVMPWGRGSGKSHFERLIFWLVVARNFGIVRDCDMKRVVGSRTIGLCPTLKQFKDIHGAALADECYGDWKQLGGKLNKQTLRIDFPDGSWFQPMPAANASSKAARGQRCDYVWCDECDDIPLEVHSSVVKPWLSEPWSLHLEADGGTPRMGRHGLLYHQHKIGEKNGKERPYPVAA
jgi:hypothetical protein